VAKEKGYHVLIYLTHENFENEKNILKEFQCGRVDGVLISISSETSQVKHINNLISNGVPVIFFDRICEKVETAMITTDDFESSYKAVKHLIQQGCDKIAFLGISKKLSISGKRLAGYFQALADHKLTADKKDVLLCTHDEHQNYLLISGLLKKKNKPNGIVASVEKLTTPVYQACLSLKLNIPEDVKLVCFSNLTTASILNPSLTTITQPAFEMGKEAAIVLFKALEKRNFNLKNESKIIPSTLIVRSSTGPF
jgi:LacI family transcriptional regulator